jgi:hypothetical protein
VRFRAFLGLKSEVSGISWTQRVRLQVFLGLVCGRQRPTYIITYMLIYFFVARGVSVSPGRLRACVRIDREYRE